MQQNRNSLVDYNWNTFPVVHIDFGAISVETIDVLTKRLQTNLRRIADDYEVELETDTPASMFDDLIYALNRKYNTDVVILIDEYDRPLIEHLDDVSVTETFRSFMDSFYQTIKGAEPLLRFVFITGVTKFAKVSVFSKLNNLTDITMDPNYACMLGYTQQELEQYFEPYIRSTVEDGVLNTRNEPLSRDQMLADIKTWYDGFRFCDGSDTVYNPVSIGQFFQFNGRFKNYWFATGTPSFLFDLLKKNSLTLLDVANPTLSDDSFNTFDVTELAREGVPVERIQQMLYQTGYLTLDEPRRIGSGLYRTRFPNHEVELSFVKYLLSVYTKRQPDSYSIKIREAAIKGDTESMMETLISFFSGLPYDIQVPAEKYYQNIIYTILVICGMNVDTEISTNTGRIDAVLDTGKHLYIMEFKLDKDVDAALKQIEDKRYTEIFLMAAKEKRQTVHRLGINFSYSRNDRNIVEWRESLD